MSTFLDLLFWALLVTAIFASSILLVAGLVRFFAHVENRFRRRQQIERDEKGRWREEP